MGLSKGDVRVARVAWIFESNVPRTVRIDFVILGGKAQLQPDQMGHGCGEVVTV